MYPVEYGLVYETFPLPHVLMSMFFFKRFHFFIFLNVRHFNHASFWIYEQSSVALMENMMVHSYHISLKFEPFGRTSSQTIEVCMIYHY